jgi:formylmethanofuran dehydrogenase subunit D
MKKVVEEYVKKCAKCQLNKTLRLKRKAPMAITTTTQHSFEKCALVIIGPVMEEVLGSKYIPTV